VRDATFLSRADKQRDREREREREREKETTECLFEGRGKKKREMSIHNDIALL